MVRQQVLLAGLEFVRVLVKSGAFTEREDLLGAPPRLPPPPVPQGPFGAHTEGMERPGCEAADQALTVAGHLDGLAQGWGGFGVLKTSQERLLRAAEGARRMGAQDVAAELEAFAPRLEGVSTPEEASALAEAFAPLVRRAWELGRRCKGSVPAHVVEKAKQLAERVNKGELSREDAIAELRAGL